MSYYAVASSDDRDRWLDARSKVVTATDLSRLAHGGAAVWSTIKAEKSGHRQNISNAYIAHGIAREPVIARWAADELGLEHNTSLLIHADDERFGATPDLLSQDNSIVADIKTAKAPEWEEPPAHYVDQVLAQMFVTGAQSGYIVTEFHADFVPTAMEPTVYVVDRDESRIAELIGIGEQFINMNEPSILDIYLHDYTRGHELELSGKAEKAAARELIEKEISETPNFTRHVSDAGSISLGKDSVKDITVFDEAAFKAEHPDLWAKYVREETKTTKGRLTITPPKREAA